MTPLRADGAKRPAPRMKTPAAAFAVDPEGQRFFDTHGYVVLRGAIPDPMLARLRAAADAWVSAGVTAAAAGRRLDDYALADGEGGPAVIRINFLHDKGAGESLALLGSPQVMGAAESLCGADAVTVYESLFVKGREAGSAVRWHQDATHSRSARVITLGVYLDDSRVGSGALRVIPGTQTATQDICAVTAGNRAYPDGAIDVEADAGDIVIHDAMLVHCSPPSADCGARRTVYFEFRAGGQVAAEGPWDEAWVRTRMRLMPPALARHARAFPHLPAHAWRPGARFRPAPAADEAAELAAVAGMRFAIPPGNFCLQPAPAAITTAPPAGSRAWLPEIAAFLEDIGLRIEWAEVPDGAFLPGILVVRDGLRIDVSKLGHAGDLLHEAGHLAGLTAEERRAPFPVVNPDPGYEMMAIAWSYAAAVRISAPPEVLFHPGGYKGGSASLIENFSVGRYIGVPMLQYFGMSCEPRLAAERGVPPYPHMLHWLRS